MIINAIRRLNVYEKEQKGKNRKDFYKNAF